ncbi:MAG: hypothetical protein ABL895_03640 [Cyclobacteriaceae bacterium]
MQDDKKKLSATEQVAQFIADAINRQMDKEARRIQKEHLFKNALGTRLKVNKPDNTDDKK